MAFVTISASTTTAFEPAANGDDIVVLPDVVMSVNGSAITTDSTDVNNINLTILGTVVSSILGVNFQHPNIDAAGNHEIYISPTGSIIGASDFFVAVSMDGTGNKFFNSGYVSGRVVNDGGSFKGANSGIMEDFDGASVLNLDSATAGVSSFTNTGTMTAGAIGVLFDLSAPADALLVTNNFTNIGTLTAIDVAIQGAASIEKIINTGTLHSVTDSAIDLAEGADKVINTGTIIGDVMLGDGTDVYRGARGLIEGAVDGGAGNDTIIGSEAADSIDGGDDNDVLTGNGGDDTLNAGEGDDTVYGGAGNDLILDVGGTALTALGGDGNDTITSSNATSLTLIGGAGDDYIANVMATTAGSTFTGGSGNDTIFMIGTSGQIVAGSGNDNVGVTGDANTITLGEGNDTLSTNGSGLVIHGGSGDDVVFLGGALGGNMVSGGAGADQLIGNAADDVLTGGDGNDGLSGQDGSDQLEGGRGADTITGGDKGDLISGGADDDLLLGDSGNDTIVGGSGDDTLIGGTQKDLLNGSSGDDAISGDGGADTLVGGSGDDSLFGGLGADLMYGGKGADFFVFTSTSEIGETAGNRDVIRDFEAGTDILFLEDLPTLVFSGTGSATGGGTASVWLGTSSGDTFVRFDFDGDGNRDAQIQLNGTTSVTEYDLFLG